MAKQMTFGLIVGNRGFFPDHLAKTGRDEMLRVLAADGIRTIALTPEESKFGAVETPTEARLCGDLFRKHRDEIDGVIVTLPNFGEERGIVDALRLSTLKVPVLVQATPDRADGHEDLRSARQFLRKDVGLQQPDAVRHSLLAHRTAHGTARLRCVPQGPGMVLRGLPRGARALPICGWAAIGARPAAFNTVRYSEKLLERSGISVDTLDLSEVLGRIERLKDNDDAVQSQACGHPVVRLHQ